MISRPNTLKIVITIIVLISFGLLIRTTDLQKVILSISQVGYRFVFLLVLTLIAYCFAAIGWKYCIGKQAQNIGITHLFFIRHIGEMVSLINPASVIGGEAFKVYMLRKKGIDKTNIIASVLISRVMMAVTQLVLFLLSFTFIFLSGKKMVPVTLLMGIIPQIALAFFTMVVVFLGYVYYFKRKIQTTRIYIFVTTLVLKWELRQVYIEIQKFFKTNLKGLLFCTLFFLLHWIIGSLEIYFILLFLGVKASVIPILLVDMGIVLFKAAGVFVPGQIGVEEIGNKIMLEFVGIPDADVWITVSILRRSRQLFWIAFGLAAYLIYYSRVSNVNSPG